MPNNFRERMTARVAAAAHGAVIEICREVRDDIRQSVSTPVVNGVRSEEGEPPYREYGDLWRGIKFKVEKKATSTEEGAVFCDRQPVASYLEFGTDRMGPRPFWGPGIRRAGNLRRRFKERLAQKLKQQSADPFGALPSAYDD